ncbi:hypothetical protein RHMOL_Rhmol10G0105300 [Rhododendron molle]|uniref:Uncharacterized protein n=2 Tax=Rhododendron molle TaxID=49168 RepID=A0ACC0M201_RHOML|nr:hypothetical protein RHMOL_Rhmol10G0105300 [Rhododendron molle]KAI8534632.1 hypothetical protein RHMOL_Rhmol10G0105300 [Rhododendron molle]
MKRERERERERERKREQERVYVEDPKLGSPKGACFCLHAASICQVMLSPNSSEHVLADRCNDQLRRNNSSVANLGSRLCITEEIKQSLIWQWELKGGTKLDMAVGAEGSSIEGSTRDQEGNDSESDKAIDWRKESNQSDTFGSSRR